MNTAPGSVRTVGPLVGGALWLVVRQLPAEHRERYHSELRAEIVTLRLGQRVIEVSSLLVAAPTMRRALRSVSAERSSEEVMVIDTAVQRGAWRCAIGRHHWIVQQDDNPENRRSAHLECTRCSRIKDTKEYVKSSNMFRRGGGMSGW